MKENTDKIKPPPPLDKETRIKLLQEAMQTAPEGKIRDAVQKQLDDLMKDNK